MQINSFLPVSLILEILYLSSTYYTLYYIILYYASHNPHYADLVGTCKNKFYENEIKLNWLNLLKNIHYGIADNGKRIILHICMYVYIYIYIDN